MGMIGTTGFATDRTAARAVANSADFRGIRRVSEYYRGNGRRRPRMAVEIASNRRPWKMTWQLPPTSADLRRDCRVAEAMTGDGRGKSHRSLREKFRGICRGLSWVAMVGTTAFATDRTAERAVATTVEIPWKCHESWPLLWNPRISAVARGNTHGRPRKFR